MDYHSVYRSNAEQYQALVGAEDVDNNLDRALGESVDLSEANVVEIGAGTGRVTRILSHAGARVSATEPAAAMISVAKRMAEGDASTTLCQAEAGSLPFPADTFDLAIAGWVYAHQREWSPDSWRTVVAGFVDEAQRIIAADGSIVLIETLGTGHEEPNPPDELEEYYRWLESSLGFRRSWIRTDYQFASVEQAAEITGAFFGPEFAALVVERGWSRVPECTGIWIRAGGSV